MNLTDAICGDVANYVGVPLKGDEDMREWFNRAAHELGYFKPGEGYFIMPIPKSPLATTNIDTEYKCSPDEFGLEYKTTTYFDLSRAAIAFYEKGLSSYLLDQICEARGYIKDKECKNISHWAISREFKCSECGAESAFGNYRLDDKIFNYRYCPNCRAKIIENNCLTDAK